MKKIIALIVLACTCNIANSATYTFNINAGSNVGNGFLTTNSTGLATSGSLVMTGGSIIGNYGLFSGGPSVTSSPSGAFIFDNMTYNSASLALDWYGLLFVGNGLEVNIWGNVGQPYSLWSYNGSSYNLQSDTASFSLQVQPVPVPAAVWLFGSALLSFLGMGKHKQGKVSAA